MKKEYIYILITYIVMQLSGIIGYPLVLIIGVKAFHISQKQMEGLANSIWIVVSFIIALIIVLSILKKSENNRSNDRNIPLPIGKSIAWAVGGIFLAFFAQYIAVIIELLLGVKVGSENTQRIIQLIEDFPLVVVVSSIVGPILEEIVFRKIIFGTLNKRFSFFFSAVISSVIFGLAHLEPVHLLLYCAMGFTFAFLYYKTKRIMVSITAHVIMNTIVVVGQILNREDIQRIMENYEKVHSFIGGFFG
ncbi:type II CAAX endopeptidase family protein [Bacillus sp. FJAT-49736]|uniref:CPBP family intramembrane glutamic endopeptidase n=1 Tax=Bacillus sp. FJAT-49736 TaxID=2833582 RepID=UPI001BC9AA08|nr:type II CAAX endopeptidase family protein [Bacillus sp. FJAT-49736]MBS4175841.1 CPBP family intramembrane metalloprotease [Bacillus sp. FJAT-49736]